MPIYDKYFDFYLTIGQDKSISYKYTGLSGDIRKSDPGNPTHLVLDDDELLALNDKDKSKRIKEQTISQLGGRLFDTVFAEPIGTEFRKALEEAESQKAGLRILLRIAAEYSHYPWEIMKSPTGYLATDTKTPLVRILPGVTNGVSLGEKNPRILLILSNVDPDYCVDIATEKANFEKIFQENPNIGSFEDAGPANVESVTVALTETMRERSKLPFNVIHFLGHGVLNENINQSFLVFQPGERERGQGKSLCEMTGNKLRELFKKGNEDMLGLIVINACSSGKILRDSSGLVPELLNIVPAVVAMRTSIFKDAAKVFTQQFYPKLLDIDISVTMQLARSQIFQSSPGEIDFSIPVLYLGYDEKLGLTATKIFEKKRTGGAQVLDPTANLTYAAETILSVLGLHDRSAKIDGNLSNLKKMNEESLRKFGQTLEAQTIEKFIFEDFTEKLNRVKVDVTENFSRSTLWTDKCDSLDCTIRNLIDIIKNGQKEKLGPSINALIQQYENLERLFAHLVAARMEEG
ncbi:MAG TPA: CHAT domain-containing protein [Candidatus Binatia bacterium]|nr:CHAT domain-containing protein [Candidatus Binatia bacterium]